VTIIVGLSHRPSKGSRPGGACRATAAARRRTSIAKQTTPDRSRLTPQCLGSRIYSCCEIPFASGSEVPLEDRFREPAWPARTDDRQGILDGFTEHRLQDFGSPLALPRHITDRIVQTILTADLVIADLTGESPNVFYELGFSHVAGCDVIMLSQKKDLPINISQEEAMASFGS